MTGEREHVESVTGRSVRIPASATIDNANQDFVSGWALHPDGIYRIDVLVGGESVGIARYGTYRRDVAERLVEIDVAGHSGFLFWFEDGFWKRFSGSKVVVKVVCHAVGGDVFEAEEKIIPTTSLPSRFGSSEQGADPSLRKSPFPIEVTRLLDRELGPAEAYGDVWTGRRLEDAVEALIYLERGASRETRGLFWYLSYLREMWLRIDANQRYFPARNRSVGSESKDVYAIGSGDVDLFVMCHHLATLRSHDVDGNVCEFGCFKGSSTAVLSVACSRLGWRLDAFDSFKGLPPSDSPYYQQGDFAGSIDEVRANVEEFGEIDVVDFHEGFFADTVETYAAESVACVWMDVDLQVSARDAIRILPRLDVRSGVFSDECEPEDFCAGEVVGNPSSDRVAEPVVEAFRANGRGVKGRFIYGHTGWFWDPSTSLPVLSPEPLLRLRDAII